MACFAGVNVSQGSVVTYARCSGIFDIHFTANLPKNLPVKFFKSVKNWQNYGQESVARLSGPSRILIAKAHFTSTTVRTHNPHQNCFKLNFSTLQENCQMQKRQSNCKIAFSISKLLSKSIFVNLTTQEQQKLPSHDSVGLISSYHLLANMHDVYWVCYGECWSIAVRC